MHGIDQRRNLHHAEHPEAGDLWQERCMFVAVVAEVTETHVLICRHRKYISRDAYMIDLDRMEWVPRVVFARWVRYPRGDATWCELARYKYDFRPGDYERPPLPTEDSNP